MIRVSRRNGPSHVTWRCDDSLIAEMRALFDWGEFAVTHSDHVNTLAVQLFVERQLCGCCGGGGATLTPTRYNSTDPAGSQDSLGKCCLGRRLRFRLSAVI